MLFGARNSGLLFDFEDLYNVPWSKADVTYDNLIGASLHRSPARFSIFSGH